MSPVQEQSAIKKKECASIWGRSGSNPSSRRCKGWAGSCCGGGGGRGRGGWPGGRCRRIVGRAGWRLGEPERAATLAELMGGGRGGPSKSGTTPVRAAARNLLLTSLPGPYGLLLPSSSEPGGRGRVGSSKVWWSGRHTKQDNKKANKERPKETGPKACGTVGRAERSCAPRLTRAVPRPLPASFPGRQHAGVVQGLWSSAIADVLAGQGCRSLPESRIASDKSAGRGGGSRNTGGVSEIQDRMPRRCQRASHGFFHGGPALNKKKE
jgi:hypothetical protein